MNRLTVLLVNVVVVIFAVLTCTNKINSPVVHNTTPFIVDFAPISVGNTWVYSTGSDYTITIIVTNITKNSGDTIIFDISVRDSGMICGSLGSCFPLDTTYAIDSIIKTPDTIVNAGNNTFFSISTKDTTNSAWGLNSIRHNNDLTWDEHYGFCKPYNNLVEYIQVNDVNNFTSGHGDSTVFIENVGLISRQGGWFDIAAGPSISGGYSVFLKTFNGKTPEQISTEYVTR